MLKDKLWVAKLSTAPDLFASPRLFSPHLASGRYLSNSITSSFHIYNNNNFQGKYLMEPTNKWSMDEIMLTHLSKFVQLCVSVDPTKADLWEWLPSGGPEK